MGPITVSRSVDNLLGKTSSSLLLGGLMPPKLFCWELDRNGYAKQNQDVVLSKEEYMDAKREK